jgi:glutamyl-tRNA reductase
VLLSLSANHKNTTFEVLECLSATDAELLPELVRSAHPAIKGAVVVSTCNRFEAYIDMDEAAGVSPVAAMNAIFDSLAQIADVQADHLRETVHFAHGNAVAQHLFSVASGLESVVIGEGEIAGQVRRSLEHARKVGTSSPELERLFQRASETSRQVKNSTVIGETGRSLVRLSLDLAESRVTNWAECRVLLVGTGRYAAASLAALRERGVTNVSVYSVSGRGAKFASSHNLPLVSRAEYPRVAASAGIIVTCTTAPHFVIEAETISAGRNMLQSALSETDHPSRENIAGTLSLVVTEPTFPERQLLIDLGLPRNINPDVRDIEGIELLDLETIRRHAPLDEENIVREARALVDSATRKFVEVGREHSVTDGVVALRAHIFDLLDGEIARVAGKTGSAATTEEALRHFAGVLLHTPMMRSREHSQRGDSREWLDGLTAMFGITPAPAVETIATTTIETGAIATIATAAIEISTIATTTIADQDQAI